jgi:phage terminase large subunit-like protein
VARERRALSLPTAPASHATNHSQPPTGRREASVGNRSAAKSVALADAGPWKAWPEKRRHLRAIRFIETYCRSPKGEGHGQPIRLAPFQKEFLRATLAPGVDIGVLATPRGNGKSSLGGALAVWALFDDDSTGSPQVPVVATTIGQGIRSCYGVAVAMIKAEPQLISRALLYTGVSTPRVTVPFNGGEMFPISNDPDGLQGLDPSLAIVDEIGFQPVESWDSLRMGAGKRAHSTIIGVGTPGFDHDNALYHLRKAIHDGAVLPRLVFREFAAPEGCRTDDRKAWRKANPAIRAGFLRESALETDHGITPEGHFRLFRLGQHVDGTDSWLGSSGRAVWDALERPWDFVAGDPTWVGVDVGIKRDSTAVVALQKGADGHLHASARFWVPSDDSPVDVTDVMEHLRELARAYDVQAISFDPRFFDVPAKMLSDEGLPLVEIPQSVERMTGVLGSLLELIKRGELHHDGDALLRQHVLNAVPRFNERGFTLQKSKSRGKIDGAIALGLAADRALREAPASEVMIAWA